MASPDTDDRARILTALHQALEPLDFVNAMWLGGSSAFARDDALSDIDVCLDVADGRQGDAFAAVEQALERISPIAHRLVVPEPAWHGHSQRVYQLADCPEHLMVDLLVQQRSTTAARFDEREIHGEPVVVFDKLGVVRAVPLDQTRHDIAVKEHFARTRTRFYLLRHLAGKEVVRGNELDAVWRYHNFVLAPLIAVLRARHAPLFHDFAPRYLKRHLPEPVYRQLLALHYVRDMDDLAQKIDAAIAWAEEEISAFERAGALDGDAGEP